ncbi:MAG: FABP family protein [Cellulomonadaceae bacterium]|nr:FABP family protein [Cellulomonadaceae bacterium]
MVFAFADNLAPEVYPMAWLVGRWRGAGFVEYPSIPKRKVIAEASFISDDGPYLRYTMTLRELDTEVLGTSGSQEADYVVGEDATGPVFACETGFWRTSAEPLEGLDDNEHHIEVFSADSAGRVTVFQGWIGHGRSELASQKVVRTESGAAVTASRRMYGFVEGRLVWHEELAAFGEELAAFSSGQMWRVEDAVADEPAPADVADDPSSTGHPADSDPTSSGHPRGSEGASQDLAEPTDVAGDEPRP